MLGSLFFGLARGAVRCRVLFMVRELCVIVSLLFVHRCARRQPLDVHREEELRLPRTVFFERVSGHGEL